MFQQRVGFFGRLGGGPVFAVPKTTYGQTTVLGDVQIGFGVDYYTRIPNLSVGVELGGFIVIPDPLIIGISIFPLVKYTF
jgi:hypothetical protein